MDNRPAGRPEEARPEERPIETGQEPQPESPAEVPPSPRREFKNEEEWAKTLGMSFDPDEAAKRAAHGADGAVPPPPQWGAGPQPPVYNAPGPGFTPGTYGNMEMRPEPMPPTYLVWAILATLCCCMPAGIAAIVFSASVSSKYYSRDYEGARRASERAQIWIIVSIVAGIIFNALYLPVAILIGS